MLMLHKPKCETIDITTFRTSNESQICWKKQLHRNPISFRIYADFEADNEKNNSSMGNKTTNIYKQNPVLNGCRIESDLENVLQSGYFKFPLAYDNVDWFVDELIKLENKMASYFKNTKKDIVKTQEDDKDYRNINICRFCEK